MRCTHRNCSACYSGPQHDARHHRNVPAADCSSVRDEEDAFSTDVFQSVRSAYKRGVLQTIRGKSKEAQAALAAARADAEDRVARARASAACEHQQARERERSAERAALALQCKQVRACEYQCRCTWLLPEHAQSRALSGERRTCAAV